MFSGSAISTPNRVLVQDEPRQQPRLTRKQLRWLKRGAKTQAYYTGRGINPAAIGEEGAHGDKARAALSKRERKAAKRARDAQAAEIGQMKAPEQLVPAMDWPLVETVDGFREVFA